MTDTSVQPAKDRDNRPGPAASTLESSSTQSRNMMRCGI